MKKILSIMMVLGLITLANAQFKIGIGGGLTMFTGPDGFTQEVPKGLGFSSAPTLNLKGKLTLPLFPIAITGTINYVMLSSEGKIPANPPLVAVAGDVEYSSNFIMVGVGGEYSFLPGPLPLKPYFSFEAFLNNGGKLTQKVAYSNGSSVENSYDGESRFGIAIGVGADMTLLPMFDLNVYAKYNLHNLIGKEDGEEGISSISLGAIVLF